MVAVTELGFIPVLTPVGDKWILLKIILLMIEKQIRVAKKSIEKKSSLPRALKKWENLKNKNSLNVTDVEELNSESNQLAKIDKDIERVAKIYKKDIFSIGSEETGHCITEGYLRLENKKKVKVFLGNGIKSAVNTFLATQILLGEKSTRTYFSNLVRPFPPGYKKTFYIYYINKKLFYKNSQLWNKVKKSIHQEARRKGFIPSFTSFSAEPNMLYITLNSNKKDRAAVFVRNSGTENKIGVNLRGPMKSASKLKYIGEKCSKVLLFHIKDFENHLYKLEENVLNQLIHGPLSNNKLKLKKPAKERVLSEMKKQGLIQLTKNGHTLTSLGKWYLSTKKYND